MPKTFNLNDYKWKSEINYRQHPEAYRVGKGEQGVLICEPYKSEILPYWKFKNEAIAKQSSQQILQLFYHYLDQDEFVGADLARKFLQMGFTRSRRYANYKGGKKYKTEDKTETYLKGSGDPEKVKSAQVFYEAWQTAEQDAHYRELKDAWIKKYG